MYLCTQCRVIRLHNVPIVLVQLCTVSSITCINSTSVKTNDPGRKLTSTKF